MQADADAISCLVRDSSILEADGRGNPPTQYRFRFHGRGLALDSHGNVISQDFHEVVVELGAAYPRMMPTLSWKTPIFHPNISNNGVVCLGGYGTHWVPSLTLAEMCSMLWDMIRMKNYDVDSPYNREAAAWIRDQKVLTFPLDARPIRNRVQNASAVVSSQNGSSEKPDANEAEVIIDGIEIVHSSVADQPGAEQQSPPPQADILFID
ncbi:MAG: ubiquitin-conjugating enzyme E2 [Pirellulaceae bacterium]